MPAQSEVPGWCFNILEFASWEDRQELLQLNRKATSFGRDEKTSLFLLRRLSVEHGLYIPSVLPKSEGSDEGSVHGDVHAEAHVVCG